MDIKAIRKELESMSGTISEYCGGLEYLWQEANPNKVGDDLCDDLETLQAEFQNLEYMLNQTLEEMGE